MQTYCRAVLDMIEAHFVAAEGGFSYSVGASQTTYYGVPITEGRPVADLHGTILLTWALAMIFALLEETPGGRAPWRVIRP
jgi:cbb3-type cytochrome oxidase subunit 1